MKIARVHIKNFRLLQNADIAMDDASTMIVGRNNSGKTSVVEIFRKLVKADRTPFTFDDISLDAHPMFEKALAAYDASLTAGEASEQEAVDDHTAKINDLPAIELALTITYKTSDDLSALAPAIMDLDPDRTDATIVYRVYVTSAFELFKAYRDADAKKPTKLFDYLRKSFSGSITSTLEAVDAQDQSNRKPLSDADLQQILSIKFIYAQNQIDDMASDSSRGLSKGFEEFYRSNQSDSAVADEISTLLEKAGENLDEKYEELFKEIYADLEGFGVGRKPSLPKLSVVSELEAVRVLKGNAHLYYNDEEGTARLPEAHNGLGYSKLIFTILQFISFHEELKRATPRPPMQLIFVEEPESHLHPQMQYVFARSIGKFVSDKDDWNAQTVITTHSSHMVAESGFDCIRYFDNSVKPLEVRDLSEFRAEQTKSPSGKAALHFLEQYMVLDRCDMFFADKLILIEGTVERLLLPRMISNVAPALKHQYLSVIEVGGAYAHLFRDMVSFLNVQTLIITDIDSVDPANGRTAVEVTTGAQLVTSNQTLKSWLPAQANIDDLLAATASTKVNDRVAVAYQIPEPDKARTGRSFEEAFILANSARLADSDAKLLASKRAFEDLAGKRLDAATIETTSYKCAKEIAKKTDFAFDILQMGDGWIVPHYIKRGLEWLNTTP